MSDSEIADQLAKIAHELTNIRDLLQKLVDRQQSRPGSS